MVTLNLPSYRSLLYVAMLLINIQCSNSGTLTTTVNTIDGSKLTAVGRSLTQNQTLELIGSAVHVSVNFEGNSCIVYASTGSGTYNYLQYELDGKYIGRLRIEGNQSLPIPIDITSTGRHELTLYKATEAQSGPIYISKIDARDIQAVPADSRPIIEFIGNSITCGASSDVSVSPCGQGQYQDHHNAYYAYGPRVARALNANYFLSSVSGIGIYRTWNQDGPSMPQLYEKADLQIASTRQWDFQRYTPAIVSIELGTNDLSAGDGVTPRAAFDSTVFIQNYTQFVKLVKSKYPLATIALLNSPMISGDSRTMLDACLKSVKNKINKQYPTDIPVEVFSFTITTNSGCIDHPNVAEHALIAQELQPFLQRLLLARR